MCGFQWPRRKVVKREQDRAWREGGREGEVVGERLNRYEIKEEK